METTERTKRFYGTVAAIFGGVILGLAVSKYSAREAYLLGQQSALRDVEKEQQIRMDHFAQYRKESCLSWWFNDSAANLKAAQFYMCQNKKRWK